MIPYTHESALASLGIRMERTDWIPRSWRFPRIPPDLDKRYPYHRLAPREFNANIDFRYRILRLGQKPENQYELWLMCRRDPLFWINTFCYLREPRGDAENVSIPWITWPLQDALWSTLDECWGVENLVIEKTREQGVTWMAHCAKPLHDMQFKTGSLIGICSENQDKVDRTDNPGSIFGMMRFLLANQPWYLKPTDLRDKLLGLSTEARKTAINGSSTTGDMFRGDRKRVVGVDESASIPNGLQVDSALASVTNCRIDVSTPKGAVGSFYRKTRPESGTRKLTLHWTINPLHSADLAFDAQGRPTSPWYERKKRELNNHPVVIAQELDISYTASDYQFFNEDDLRRAQDRHQRKPVARGRLEYKADRDDLGRATRIHSVEFVEDNSGPLEAWCQRRSDGSPIRGAYAIGCDISMGTGASNSAASVRDCITGEKAAQLVTSKLDPPRFAEATIALGMWFGGHGGEARIGFERNGGAGSLFKDELIRLGYGNVYFQRRDDDIDRGMTRKPGWWSTPRSKAAALAEYRSAVSDGRFIEHSEHAYDEHRLYVVAPDGTIHHSAEDTCEDPTGAGDNHGDIVIANMIALIVSSEVDTLDELEEEPVERPGWGSWEEREQALEDRKKPTTRVY